MNVITASSILLEQNNQLSNLLQNSSLICNQINNIANQENSNSVPDINERIKGLCGALYVQMSAIKSQTVLLEQALDQLSQLVN